MSRAKPNLFIIGAAKSGTTSLHHYLGGHPEIYMSDPKEPGYFVEEIDAYPSDEGWYLSLFEEGTNARYRGESSTHYTKLPVYAGVPDRIAAFCDSPRFIYLMRDPIDRAISHFWHNTRQNAEFRPPLRAMKENVEYKAFGDYARQLEPYFDLFPRDRFFLATFERLVSDPEEVTEEIFEWLDLDPGRAPEGFPTENTRPRTITRFTLGKTVGEFLHDSRIWGALSPVFPQSVKELGKRLVTSDVAPSELSMDEVVDYLRPWAEDAMSRTSEYLDREFPEWTTTLDRN